jgi:pimeloyl-ACP methyl ester carboxylesterase
MATLHKGFVHVPHGQVHFRNSGYGPPIVLLHDSPRSSIMHEPQIQALADEFAVIALDTPGYGLSSPLPGKSPLTMNDFAEALGVTLTALGIERCALYGFHTSSKIVLQFALSHPERVAIAVMDGLNLPPGGPSEDFIARYMRPFEISDDGSHLTSAWTRGRDLHRFFPWFDRSPKSRLPLTLPDDNYLHRYVLDLLMAGPHYADAYAAAMRYPAMAALPGLRAPAVFTCRANDPLYPYLDVLEKQLPERARIERLSGDRGEWLEALRNMFRAARPSTTPSIFDPADRMQARPDLGARQSIYVELAHGPVRLQRYGRPNSRPPLLLLHDTPGSCVSLSRLAERVGQRRLVYTLDFPGEGESAPLANVDASHYTTVLTALLERLGAEQFDVYADGWAVPFAVALANAAPQRISKLTLDAIPLITVAERRAWWKQYCPSLVPRADGAHLLAIWHCLRDREISWPWFARDTSAIRTRESQLEPHALHAIVTDLAKQPDNYADAWRAAVEFPLNDGLAALRGAVTVIDNSLDPRYGGTAKARRALRGAAVTLAATVEESL